MMKFFILIAVILISSVIVVFIAKRKKTNNNALIATNPKSSAINDHYNALREMALGVTEVQLGLNLAKDQTVVYGVVMDMGMDDGIATLISFSTGDASLYTSTGGGIIGGGQHENVAATAKAYVRAAQSVIEKAQKSINYTFTRQRSGFLLFSN